LRALRAVSTERGRDAREFALMAFGGSGPIHAAGLGRELHCPKVIVPPLPGLFSALGLLLSVIEHHNVRSCYLQGETLTAANLLAICDEVERSLLNQFDHDTIDGTGVRFSYTADTRYRGQASLISIPLLSSVERGCATITPHTVQRLCAAFETEHEKLYGHRSDPENPVQVVAVRVIGRWGDANHEELLQAVDYNFADGGSRLAYFGPSWGQRETRVIARGDLKGVVDGPLLIDEYDSTTVVPPGMRACCDADGNIIMECHDA